MHLMGLRFKSIGKNVTECMSLYIQNHLSKLNPDFYRTSVQNKKSNYNPSTHPLSMPLIVQGHREDGTNPCWLQARVPKGGQSIVERTQRRKTVHTGIQPYSQFRVTSWPNLHAFGLSEETGTQGGNSTQKGPWWPPGLTPEPYCCRQCQKSHHWAFQELKK